MESDRSIQKIERDAVRLLKLLCSYIEKSASSPPGPRQKTIKPASILKTPTPNFQLLDKMLMKRIEMSPLTPYNPHR
jgi:hypothetical protein